MKEKRSSLKIVDELKLSRTSQMSKLNFSGQNMNQEKTVLDGMHFFK